MSTTRAVLFLHLVLNVSALTVTFPPKSLKHRLQNVTTAPEIDITAANVTNLSVEDINKIAEGLPPQNSTARNVFIVYAQSVKDERKAVALPEQEAYIVEAQKLMSMVADMDTAASNSHALAARSRGTDRLSPEERKNKLHMLFRNKNVTKETPKTKRYSYTDNFEPLRIPKNTTDFPTAVPENITDNLIDEDATQAPTTVSYSPIRQQTNTYFTNPPPGFVNPPAVHFEPPNKQFYGYVRHDLHLIDSANKQQQPYLSVQQPVYQRNQFGEKNFQAHIQHPPVENFYRQVPFQAAGNSFNQRDARPVQNQFQDNAFNQARPVQNQVFHQTFGQQGYPLSPQQQSFFGRIIPMFG